MNKKEMNKYNTEVAEEILDDEFLEDDEYLDGDFLEDDELLEDDEVADDDDEILEEVEEVKPTKKKKEEIVEEYEEDDEEILEDNEAAEEDDEIIIEEEEEVVKPTKKKKEVVEEDEEEILEDNEVADDDDFLEDDEEEVVVKKPVKKVVKKVSKIQEKKKQAVEEDDDEEEEVVVKKPVKKQAAKKTTATRKRLPESSEKVNTKRYDSLLQSVVKEKIEPYNRIMKARSQGKTREIPPSKRVSRDLLNKLITEKFNQPDSSIKKAIASIYGVIDTEVKPLPVARTNDIVDTVFSVIYDLLSIESGIDMFKNEDITFVLQGKIEEEKVMDLAKINKGAVKIAEHLRVDSKMFLASHLKTTGTLKNGKFVPKKK